MTTNGEPKKAYSRDELFGIRMAVDHNEDGVPTYVKTVDGTFKEFANQSAGAHHHGPPHHGKAAPTELSWRRGGDNHASHHGGRSLRRSDMSSGSFSMLDELRADNKTHQPSNANTFSSQHSDDNSSSNNSPSFGTALRGAPAGATGIAPEAENDSSWVYRTKGTTVVSAPTPWGEIQTLIDEQLVERDDLEVRCTEESEFIPYLRALSMRNSRLAPQPVSLDDIDGLSSKPPVGVIGSSPKRKESSCGSSSFTASTTTMVSANNSTAPGGALGLPLSVDADVLPVGSYDPFSAHLSQQQESSSAAAETKKAPSLPQPILPPEPLLPNEAQGGQVSSNSNSSSSTGKKKEAQGAKKKQQQQQQAPPKQPEPVKAAPMAWGGKGVAPKSQKVDLEALIEEERHIETEKRKQQQKAAAVTNNNNSQQENVKKTSTAKKSSGFDDSFPALESLGSAGPSRKK